MTVLKIVAKNKKISKFLVDILFELEKYMKLKVIKTREGDLVNFDRTRIERVIEKAAESV
jgi:hypothetical protein